MNFEKFHFESELRLKDFQYFQLKLSKLSF